MVARLSLSIERRKSVEYPINVDKKYDIRKELLLIRDEKTQDIYKSIKDAFDKK